AQIVAERETRSEVVAEGMPRRAGKIVVDVVGNDLAFSDSAAAGDVGALLRAPFETLVRPVVAAQRVVELEPIVGGVFAVDVGNDSSDLVAVQLLKNRVERIVEDAIFGEVGKIGILQVVTA